MYHPVSLSENIFWLGANDRKTTLFENLWPIENGVAYHSYLILGEKTALVDAIELSKAPDLIRKIKTLLQGKPLNYLIINHMEPDHGGAIEEIVKHFPDVKLIGNRMTFSLVKSFFDISENCQLIQNEETLDLGKFQLKFYLTPWVHWPETMMTYETHTKTLFSSDSFGSYGTLDGGIFDDEVNFDFYENEMLRYYANIVAKYSNYVKNAIDSLQNVKIATIAPAHGIIWRENIEKVVKLYYKWATNQTENGAVIVFGSMYGNTEKMADIIGRRLSENGIKNIRIYDSSKTHLSYILRDIWKYKALILGSCAYNGGLFPAMLQLMETLEHNETPQRITATFGSSGWNKAGVKVLNEFLTRMKWNAVTESAETKGSPDKNAIEKCLTIADKIAEELKK